MKNDENLIVFSRLNTLLADQTDKNLVNHWSVKFLFLYNLHTSILVDTMC